MRNPGMKVVTTLMVATALSGAGHAQSPKEHLITVSGTGRVFAQPDLGILVMQIQSSSPLAADAAHEDSREASSVRSALKVLGYSADDFELTPIVFTRAGGAYYGPNQPSITGFKAQRFVYVFFTGDVLKVPAQMSKKAAQVIDALAKAGATMVNPYPGQQSALVVYTVRDPSPYEERALVQALGQARKSAQDLAKKLGIELGGLQSVTTDFVEGGTVGGVIGSVGPYPQSPANALAELPYRFYSTREDQVEVSVVVGLKYNFR